MASNRPMFDDEDLPAWLKAAGMTYGGHGGQLPPSPATGSQPGGAELSWAGEIFAGASAQVPSENAPWLQGAAPAEPLAPASDEALPWLEDVAPAETALPTAPAFDETLPWESPPAPAEAPPGEQAPGEMDWQQPATSTPAADSSQIRTGVTGMLPWRQGTAAPQDQPSPVDSLAGQTGQPWDNLPTDTEPDWLQDFSLQPEQGQPQEPVAPPEPPAGTPKSIKPLSPKPSAAPATPSSDDLSWLDETPQQPTPQAAAPATPSSEDFSWLDETPQEPAPQAAAPATPSPEDFSWPDEVPQEPAPQAAEPPAAPPAAAPIKPIKKLPKAEAAEQPPAQPPVQPIRPLTPPPAQPAQPTQPPAAEAPQPAIKRLPSKPQPPEQAGPDLSSMTYEQWEQAQIAKEQEAQSDPGDKLLDEVPEWFSGAGTPPPTPSQVPPPGGPEFMPDWYLGMEEQAQDAAPDWFTDMDLSSTPLAGPETIQTPSEPPAPAPATPAEDVPDWFKGAGVDNLDFDTLFGAQPTEPAPEPSPAKPSQLPQRPSEPNAPPPTPPVAEEAPAPPPTSAAAEPLDWMAELPDLSTWEPEESGQPAQPVSEPEPAKPEPSELPMDWFAEPEAPQQAEQPERQPEADLLDWMATESKPESPAPSGPEIAGEEVPTWMQETAPDESQIVSPAQPAPDLIDSDVPAWLREVPPSEIETPAVSEVDSEAELDWLADFEAPAAPPPASAAPVQPAQAPVPEPAKPVEGGELDLSAPVDIDALLSLVPSDYTPPVAPVVPVEKDAQALARVDTDFDLDALLGPPPDESQPQAETIDLDALGAQLPPPTAPGEPTEPPRTGRIRRVPASAPQAAQDVPRPREELPEWIAEMRPSEAPVSLRIGDQEVRIQEKPIVPMNDQLRQLRERGRAFREQVTEPPTPTAGPLSGITGAIQTIPEVVQPAGVGGASALVITDAQARRVKLIHKVLELEESMFRERAAKAAAEESLAPAARRVPRARPKFDRYVITLLLALAIVVPFFWDGLNIIPAPDLSQLTPTQASVASAADTIQPQQLTLVAFEYGPTGAGELDDLARTILRDIIKRGGLPVIVSTNPAGAMRAQALMAALGVKDNDLILMNRTQPLVARQDYIVLRYLPGGAAGVRSVVNAILSGGFQQQIVFSTDIEGKPLALDNIASLKTSPAFIIAENADDVRNWAEQYQAPQGEKPLTIVLLTSAGASAVADAYVRSASETDGHIIGPLVGFRDTMTYQAVRQSPSSSAQKLAAQRWQSIGLSALLAGVVIVVGMAVNLIRSLQRRRRR
jgi:hypothetical protein